VVMGEPVWSARWPLRRSATVTAASANPGLPCCAGNTPTILAFRLSGLCRRDHPAQHGHQNLSRRPSPHVRATRRWPVKCRRGHHGGSVPLTGSRSRVGVGCLSIVLSVAARAGQVSAPVAHCRVSATHSQTMGATTMQTDADSMGHEERRALLEQRRAVVARQLRRLAVELADLDRQLDEIEQSER